MTGKNEKNGKSEILLKKVAGNNDVPPARKDSEIWNDFIEGSDAALVSLYSNFVEKLYVYGCHLVKDDEGLVRDCIQDVFFELISKRERISKTVSPKFYLYASLRRRILRQNKRNRLILYKENLNDENGFLIEADQNLTFVNSSLSNEQKKIIAEACNKLSHRQREAIVLHFFEDMSYSEIATIMNLGKVKSARALIYRALASLLDVLKHVKSELLILICLALPGRGLF